MTTGTRSLPTDSSVQPIERGHMSEGVSSDIGLLGDVPHGGMQIPPHHLGEIPHISPGGIEYHPIVSKSDRLSTYTGLDDYDTLFEARHGHGRGALDNMPRTSGEATATSSIGVTPVSLSVGVIENLMVRIKPIPDSGLLPTSQREHVSASANPSLIGHRVVSQMGSGRIIGEGAAIFTNMT